MGSVRSFRRVVCFQMVFRHSVRARSGVWRVVPFLMAVLISVRACWELGSFRVSLIMMFESRISFGVLCPP